MKSETLAGTTCLNPMRLIIAAADKDREAGRTLDVLAILVVLSALGEGKREGCSCEPSRQRQIAGGA